MRKLLFLLLFLILIIKSTHSIKYAEGKIYLVGDEIKSELDSNVEVLKNYRLVKNGTQYLLEINSEELDYYIISLVFKNPVKLVSFSLPKTSQLIMDESLIIKSIGEKEPYSVSITYEILNEPKTSNLVYLFYGTLGILLFFALYLIFIFFKKPLKRINTAFFPEKEKKIIEILLKRKKITQSELQRLLSIPKASLHRYLKNLQQRDYIEIHPYGMTNLIILKEKEENKS